MFAHSSAIDCGTIRGNLMTNMPSLVDAVKDYKGIKCHGTISHGRITRGQVSEKKIQLQED